MERNSRKLIARLKKEGWVQFHVVGSHHHFKHPERKGKVTIPHPRKDIPTGTVMEIYLQAGWRRR